MDKTVEVSGAAGQIAAQEPGPVGLQVTGRSRLELRELSITANDDSFLVGDLTHGEFIEVPEIGVVVIDALRDGHTVAETAQIAQSHAGTEVDVADFIAVLLEVGFVMSIDGTAVAADSPELTDGGRAGAVAARLARPFYSRSAMAAYGLLLVACGTALTTLSWLRPRYGQLFFLSNPVLSFALLAIIAMPLLMFHEAAHWLGARVEGIPARVSLSRRYYFMVAQTDLTGLWALPPRRRFAPLLAGMAFDTVTVSVLLCARVAQHLGWWHPAPAVSRLIVALVLLQVFSISFQFAFFLRTDLYAVLVVCSGCRNLSRVSRLTMAGWYRARTAAEDGELAAADPRDKAVARWYVWAQVGGGALAAYYFAAFFVPATVFTLRAVASGLTQSSPASMRFWLLLVCDCFVLVPIVFPPVSYLRERRTRAGERPLSKAGQ